MSRFGRASRRGPIQPTPTIPPAIARTSAIPIQRPRPGPRPRPDPPIATGRTLYPSSRRSVMRSTYIPDRARVRVRLYSPPMSTIDLRSDTVTVPTDEMRRAMAAAEVGDDVWGEDPTVNKLEKRAAETFGKEAALFVPTGCMGNLISIKIWTHHGNEVICEERSHVNLYELASMSAIAGCMPRVARGEDGILTWEEIKAVIRPKIYYDSQTALVCLENTSNMAGGTVYSTDRMN